MVTHIKDNMVFFTCFHCKSTLKAPEELCGKEGICPQCKNKIKIPIVSEHTAKEDK